MSSVDLDHRRDTYGMGLAYVWGRQDAGESGRDTGYSTTFANAYAVADAVTDGYGGNLQGAYHEWHDTGRLVRIVGDRIVGIAPADGPDTTRVEAHPIPWAGDRYSLPYWPGIVREVTA